MKKSILIALMLLLSFFAVPADAESGPLTLQVNGNGAKNTFYVSLSPDGRQYRIVSNTLLEVGGDICSHPEGVGTELACNAPAIAGFEVNTFGESDTVTFTGDIPAPVTIRAGPGNDRLRGGGASDKLVGGTGDDVLIGRRGNDWIEGGPGDDRLIGGLGDDQLRGGPGKDKLIGGPGHNTLVP